MSEPTHAHPCAPHAETILDLYGAGRSIRTIARRLGIPKSIVHRWMAGEAGDDYAGRIARARAAHAAALVEDAGRVIDAAEPAPGPVGKAREQAGHRRWVAGRLDRQAWGDQVQVDARVRVEGGVVAFVALQQAAALGLAAEAGRRVALPAAAAPDEVDDGEPEDEDEPKE